jgi:hypothetical protein
MRALLANADGIIKDLGRPLRPIPWPMLALVVLCAGPIYGAFMGSYALESAERVWVVVFSAVKVPLLILATTLVCMPGFLVLNTVLGLRDDLNAAVRAIMAGQAALTVALASLGPITRFFYQCGAPYNSALIFNALMFTVATAVGQVVLLRRYRPLTAEPVRGGRHLLMLWTWVGLYAFVGMQMGWMLRPFIGSPEMPVVFLRPEPFSNAYTEIIRIFLGR